ncbi:MAG: kelch repeat-containing protein, partial [Planctomycetota bacterium]|nr:kelch repeat-containing protein [Planctomycetota bacterium]
DSARQRLVLFGGTAASGSFLNDTWEWDGNTWLQRATATSPPSQFVHAMAFDSARAVTVLFPGAFGGSAVFEYDGVTWTPRPTAVSPPYRLNASLAFDKRRARTVLFGGHANLFFDDCWEWDGTQWTVTSPALRPPGRTGAGMVFDEVRGRIVLFGGASATWAPLADVWEWDGANWTPRTFVTSPPPRLTPGLAYDAARGRLVMFGGHGGPGAGGMQDTWELLTPCDRAGPGEVAGGGLPCGCATPPKLGTNFCVSYTNPNTAGVQFLLLAVGRCSSPALVVQPPTACAPSFLYVPPMAVLTTTGNPATFCMALPANPAFVGTALCLQGASLETNCLRATDGLIVITQ